MATVRTAQAECPCSLGASPNAKWSCSSIREVYTPWCSGDCYVASGATLLKFPSPRACYAVHAGASNHRGSASPSKGALIGIIMGSLGGVRVALCDGIVVGVVLPQVLVPHVPS